MSDAFQRWQTKKIEHSASMSNLLLTLALGGLAFLFSMLDKRTASMSPTLSAEFVGSGLMFLTSGACALLGMASRLDDFRASAQAARLREADEVDERRLDQERETHRSAGRRTNFYLNAQVLLFCMGMVLLSALVLDVNYYKLFPLRQPNKASAPMAPNIAPPAGVGKP